VVCKLGNYPSMGHNGHLKYSAVLVVSGSVITYD